jgi:hypothetical protein
MKRGDEALNASLLQFLNSVKRFIASLLRFFLSVKRFVAVIFYGKPSFNASSPLLFKRNSLFNASSPLLLKVTLPTSAFAFALQRSWLFRARTFTHLFSFRAPGFLLRSLFPFALTHTQDTIGGRPIR